MPQPEDHLTKLQVLKLIQSVNTKDIHQITKLINFGIPGLVNYSEPHEGLTGLHIATSANDDMIMKTLISFGADCNVVDNLGRTPFMAAAELGHVEALTLLLDLCEGLNISAEDHSGQNILFYCLHGTKRHETCLELALKRGADIHTMDKSGNLLLHKACKAGLDVMVELLLEAGINADRTDNSPETVKCSGASALHIASELGNVDCARLLLKYKANPDLCDNENYHSAHKAALGNHYEILKLLSAYGGDLGTLTNDGNTPLHFAAQNGFAPICKFLGQRGCVATTKNGDGRTARVLAKHNGHKLAVKMCRKAERTKSGKSGTQLPFVKFYDWMMEHKDLIRTDILQYDKDAKGKIKTSDLVPILLSYKSPLDETEVLPILKVNDIQKDGNVDYETLFTGKKFINKLYLTVPVPRKARGKGKGGKHRKFKTEVPICTKLEDVRRESGGPLINYIEKQMAITDHTRFSGDHQPENIIQDDSLWYCHSPDPTFVHVNEAVKYNDKESITVAIKEGFDINEKDRFYKTPLMLACLEGNYEIAQLLIENGAQVNAVDNFKWSALHFACHAGQLDIVQLLLNNGALIDVQSLNGGTPLMRAIESTKSDVVQLLINLNAKVHLMNKKGLKALDIAEAYADQRIIEIIEKKTKEALPKEKTKGRKSSPTKRTTNKVGARSSSTLPTSKGAGESSLQGSRPKAKSASPPSSSKTKRISVLRAASAIANGDTRGESITYNVPKKAWVPVPTPTERLAQKSSRRARFGFAVDFDDFKPPYQCHVDELAKKMVDNT